MIKNKKGFTITELITSTSLFLLFVYFSSYFLSIFISNYVHIYKDLSSVNEILFALNSIEENIFISSELLNEPGFNSDESNLSLGYYDEGLFKKVSYSLYQNKIRKKMMNITYLTTGDACISSFKFFYSGNLIKYLLITKYGNYISNISGSAIIPGKI